MSNLVLPSETMSTAVLSTDATSTEVIRQFVFRQNPATTVLCVLPMVVGFGSCLCLAVAPGQEIIKVGGFNITPARLQWIMAFGGLAALYGLVHHIKAQIKSLRNPLHVALTDQSILVPAPNWRGICVGPALIEVKYKDIAAIAVLHIGQAVQLQITHVGGKLGIPSNMLPSRRDFDLLSQMLTKVCEMAKGQ